MDKQHFPRWPFSSQSLVEKLSAHAERSRPFSHGHRRAIVGELMIIASIVLLFQIISPPAIFWFVVTVWINSVNLISVRWSLSHVGVKILKRHPSFADSNPSSSIVPVTNRITVVASGAHRVPDSINRLIRLAMGSIVTFTHACNHLISQATTAFCQTLYERAEIYKTFLSAITSARNHGRCRTIGGVMLDGKESKAISDIYGVFYFSFHRCT